MGNSLDRPGADYSRQGAIRAISFAAMPANTVVWVASRQSKRRIVKAADATSTATGARAALFITVGGVAAAGQTLLITDRALVTNRDPVTGDFAAIAALAGGAAGDPVYLKNGGGISMDPADATVDRIIGTKIDAFSFEFGPISGTF